MWYKNQAISLPKPIRRSPTGRFDPDVEKARALGIRYKPWSDVMVHWFANAGITRPYLRFIAPEPYRLYSSLMALGERGNVQAVLEAQDQALGRTRASLKAVFGPESRVVFDSNGSCAISTLTKFIRAGQAHFSSLTFSDQGRLVYSALGFEAESVARFRQNFEQPLALFEAPLEAERIQTPPSMPSHVQVINLFHPDLTYRSDGLLMDEFVRTLIGRADLKMALLLHVSRTGRILPVEEMIRLARELRPDVKLIVDGSQAVGRITFGSMRSVYNMADGYVLVGHKSLGSMICGAAVIKPELEAFMLHRASIAPLYHYKLFQFESDEFNLALLDHARRSGKPYYLVSAPEILSMGLAFEHSLAHYWESQALIGQQKERLTAFLSATPQIQLNVNRCPVVDDIVSFHTVPPERGAELKQYLQDLQPPITIAPLTENGAVRIALDPKLPHLDLAVDYLMDSLRAFCMDRLGA